MHHLNAAEIKQFELFRQLSAEQWAEVYPLFHHLWLIEGEQLIRQKDRARTFFILLRGHFMIHYEDGRAFTLKEKGDVMGWSAVITPFEYTASVTALTDGEVLSIPGPRFLELIQNNAALGEKMVKKIIEIIHRRPSIE